MFFNQGIISNTDFTDRLYVGHCNATWMPEQAAGFFTPPPAGFGKHGAKQAFR